ncbi:MAG: M23 family metallopeptidase [Flavobacteriales bacterium]
MKEEERDQRDRSAIRRRLKKLRKRYVLALVNRRTFEEKASIELTPLNLLLLVSGTLFVTVFLFALLVSLTPVKRYIPGFPTQAMEDRSIQAVSKADSLERELHMMKEHFQRMRSVFDGKVDSSEAGSLKDGKASLGSLSKKAGAEKTKKRIARDKEIPLEAYFYPPLRGSLTDEFDPPGYHFGVDLTAEKGKAIKATLQGTVVFASWTPDQGNVIQIQHPHGLFSVYKHNSILLKEAGQKVRTGDPIAIIGNTGELTTGPHLHFELWHQGEPIDPEEVMVF